MIKIKNPYSRKRFTFKERFYKKITDLTVPYIKKIPLQEDRSVKQKYIPEVLHSARQVIEGWERYAWSTKKPDDIKVDFLSLYVAEYIPIENVDILNKGLKKLYKKYPARFGYGQNAQIDEFCNEVKQCIHGGRWSNFGFLDFSKEENLSDLIKQVHVHGTHVSSSSIIVQFIITPSDSFINKYKEVVDTDVKDGNVFTPSFKTFFKFWGSSGIPGSSVKEQMLEDLRLELKWRTMKEVSKYFDLYFTNNKLTPPSIEVYKLKQLSCKFKEEEHEKRNKFWESIGMHFFHYHDISKDGYWQLFSNERNHLKDSSLKITCNSEIKREPMFHTLDFQIVYLVEEFAKDLLPVLVMREYALDLSKKIALQQKDTFSSIKKEKPKYRKLINIRYELEQNLHILKRFKNEIGENYFDRVKKRIMKISEFEPSRPNFINKVWTEIIVDNTNYLINKTHRHSQNFAKMIDDTVKLLEIRTNNSLRKLTYSLTITTVILSVVATTIAGISLYFQFNEETRQSLNELLNLVKNFFI